MDIIYNEVFPATKNYLLPGLGNVEFLRDYAFSYTPNFIDAYSVEISNLHPGNTKTIKYLAGLENVLRVVEFNITTYDGETGPYETIQAIQRKAPENVLEAPYRVINDEIMASQIRIHAANNPEYLDMMRFDMSKLMIWPREDNILQYDPDSEKMFKIHPSSYGGTRISFAKHNSYGENKIIEFLYRQAVITLVREYNRPVSVVHKSHENFFINTLQKCGMHPIKVRLSEKLD